MKSAAEFMLRGWGRRGAVVCSMSLAAALTALVLSTDGAVLLLILACILYALFALASIRVIGASHVNLMVRCLTLYGWTAPIAVSNPRFLHTCRVVCGHSAHVLRPGSSGFAA